MRTLFTYLAMVILLLLLFKFNIFAWFAHKGAWVVTIILLVAVFSVAIRILGNPFSTKGENDEDNQ